MQNVLRFSARTRLRSLLAMKVMKTYVSEFSFIDCFKGATSRAFYCFRLITHAQ